MAAMWLAYFFQVGTVSILPAALVNQAAISNGEMNL